MTSNGKRLVIAPSVRKYWHDGKVCPENGNYQLTFLLESAIAGDSKRYINLRINSIIPGDERLKFADIEVQEA